MNSVFKFVFLILVFPIFFVHANELNNRESEIVPFTLITIPKSGSHMIIKALHLMTGSSPVWHTHFPSFWCIPPDQGFLYTHFCLTEQLEQNYRDLPQLKKIIAIRDLRDVAVSIVGQIQKTPWPGMNQAQRDAFNRLTFDEQLLFVIEYEYDIYEIAETAPNSNQASLVRVVEQAVEYSSDPNHLVIRYEDLVGPNGGGDVSLQREVLRSIAQFIQVDLSEQQLSNIADQLYGNQVNPFGKDALKNYKSTFSRGKIGAWKDAFKEEHKVAFKQKIGNALIALGYENDNNW